MDVCLTQFDLILIETVNQHDHNVSKLSHEKVLAIVKKSYKIANTVSINDRVDVTNNFDLQELYLLNVGTEAATEVFLETASAGIIYNFEQSMSRPGLV